MTYTVAVVGTGADPDSPDSNGYAMAYRHARAYERLENCRLVACADVVVENARAFAETFAIPPERVYENYERLLAEVEPDVVSVCVPPAVHAEIVVGCAESGVVQGIHCEKPMAKTWGECREMVRVCDDHGVQLTFNHQRRFGGPFRTAKRLLDAGEIGELARVDVGGPNLYDYGSHLFDLCGYFTDQTPAEWVMAQIDYSEENLQFGVHNENRAIAQWRYEDGTYGTASTGADSTLNCELRLVGSEGTLEIGVDGGPALRMRTSGGWKTVDTDGDGIHGPTPGLVGRAAKQVKSRVPFLPVDRLTPDAPTFIDRAVADVVSALDEGRRPELAAENALQATELIFACWESARRRGRVDLPLEVDSNPLEEMVEAGEMLAASRIAE
ncbi:Predicted dehydrogenase [Halogranum amylolyticum]|uniref:Predicted dehydrogenase n=1 Tax=Halogranum amylolyticum TaxID=660520 RepID=A0A1H8N0F2_9EURY|nr:Gfo/Idh/MocA family oxidoreductase [Halogranum amylolyticum]SEO22958.1 Predicted dehydrogenase [Halogranum amylolyticum]